MTAYALGVEVACEGPDGSRDCPESAAVRARSASMTAADVRADGRKDGWARQLRGGQLVDLCPACKVARGGSIEVADYLSEVEQSVYNRSADYHPAAAREPRRVLALNGAALGGANNGEARDDWGQKANVTVHAAVTGQGYAYGAAVAGCDGSMELDYEADASGLVELHRVDAQLLCRRPGCRKRIEQELTKETRNPG